MPMGTASPIDNLDKAPAHELAGGIPLSARLFSIFRIATATRQKHWEALSLPFAILANSLHRLTA